MSVNPLSSAFRLQNPTLHASPSRYSSLDQGTLFGSFNRTVSQLADFIPWVKIDGARLEIRGHEESSNGRSAAFVSNQGTAMPPVETDPEPYVISNPAGVPSYSLDLAQLTALVENRDYARDLLSENYPQLEFQKDAARHTIRKLWEAAAITGGIVDTPPPPFSGVFDGLAKLVTDGHGKAITASTGGASALDDFDEAFEGVVAHNRRVDLIVMNQAAWRNVVRLLRNRGVTPDFRIAPQTGQQTLYYNGVPICLTDFLPTSGGQSEVFFMTLGEPDGVFAIVNKDRPGIEFKTTHNENSAFKSVQADFYSALVSTTDDALVALQSWPAGS